MAMKRTKADKALRQADELESKLERHPAQVPKKTATLEEPQPGPRPDRQRGHEGTLVRDSPRPDSHEVSGFGDPRAKTSRSIRPGTQLLVGRCRDR
jgi:hypothetical protein